MKKTIKETVKKIKEKILPAKVEEKKVCPKCLGTGLWNPQFTNSPQCATCVGHGVI